MNRAHLFEDFQSYMDHQAHDHFETQWSPEREKGISLSYLNLKKAELPKEQLQRLENEILGFGPLESLIADTQITEIIVNKYDEIYFEKLGQVLKHPEAFFSEASYHRALERICYEAKIEINSSRPHCDGTWRGFRVHLIGEPISPMGSKLTLRRNSHNTWTLEKLQEAQWCTENEKEWLKELINKKANVLVVGPTNTGKTTCLNACLAEVKDSERLVFIEDTDELAPPNAISVKLLTRPESDLDLKEYTQQELLFQSLRMRPDRIIVGEVRGGEAKDFLMALATGHRGSWCSLHAEGPWQALSRLELLIQMAQPQWKSESIRQLIHMGLDEIICLENKNGKRRVAAIHKLAGLESTGFCLERFGEDY